MAEEDKISFMDAIKKYKEGLNKGSQNIDNESEIVDNNKGSSLSGKKRHGSSNLNDENTVIYGKQSKVTISLGDSNLQENVCKVCKKQFSRILAHINKSTCKSSYTKEQIEEIEKEIKNKRMEKININRHRKPVAN